MLLLLKTCKIDLTQCYIYPPPLPISHCGCQVMKMNCGQVCGTQFRYNNHPLGYHMYYFTGQRGSCPVFTGLARNHCRIYLIFAFDIFKTSSNRENKDKYIQINNGLLQHNLLICFILKNTPVYSDEFRTIQFLLPNSKTILLVSAHL